MKYQRFEQLPVWQAAINLAERMFTLTRRRGFAAMGDLRDQLRRAALSVSNNIAEGFERGTTAELLSFLYIARGSAGEVRSMLLFCRRLLNNPPLAEDLLRNDTPTLDVPRNHAPTHDPSRSNTPAQDALPDNAPAKGALPDNSPANGALPDNSPAARGNLKSQISNLRPPNTDALSQISDLKSPRADLTSQIS
ncbi:MAG: four helix bundle protein, partial [Planctomycetota bacterium]